MNILILVPSYPDQNNTWKGIFFQEQAKALSKRHKIHVISVSVDYQSKISFCKYTFRNISKKNLIETRVKVARSFPIYNQLNYFITSFFLIRNILKKEKIDIIHCHFAYPIGVLGFLLSKYFKVPYVITEHASKFENRFKSIIHKMLTLKVLKKADKIIAVGNSLKKEIEKYITKPISVVPNVVNVSKFYSKKRYTNNIDIGFLGALNGERKGLDILLKALSEVENNNYFLHVGGNGKLLSKYKDDSKNIGIYNKCIFYGVIAPEKVPDFFSKLDVFVLPSRKESFGVVVIEAMASGIPVIGTICGGPEEIITKETGLLIEKENIQELKNAIDFILKNLKLYNSKKIRNYVDEKFGTDIFVNKLTKIYQELIEK